MGDGAGPLPVELPDGSLKVDLRPQIRVPSSNVESWDEAACTNAFHALAEVTENSSIDSYREFAVLLPSIKLTYEEFSTWCTKRGFSVPTFWVSPDEARRRHTSAASSAGSNDDAVAPREKRKTWQSKPGKLLTASEIAVVRAMNELWPDGKLDLRAKARDKQISNRLGVSSSHRELFSGRSKKYISPKACRFRRILSRSVASWRAKRQSTVVTSCAFASHEGL